MTIKTIFKSQYVIDCVCPHNKLLCYQPAYYKNFLFVYTLSKLHML